MILRTILTSIVASEPFGSAGNMNIQIRTNDLEGLIRNIERTLPGLVARRVIGDGMIAAAQKARDRARLSNAFMDRTGRLRRSIRASRRSVRAYSSVGRQVIKVAGGAAQLRAGGRGARQAHLIEAGTVKARKRPYIKPAVEGLVGTVLQVAARAMRESLNRHRAQIESGRTTTLTRRLAGL